MNVFQYRVAYIRREPAGNTSFGDIRFIVNVDDMSERLLSHEAVATEYKWLNKGTTVLEVERITTQKLAWLALLCDGKQSSSKNPIRSVEANTKTDCLTK